MISLFKNNVYTIPTLCRGPCDFLFDFGDETVSIFLESMHLLAPAGDLVLLNVCSTQGKQKYRHHMT
jgi:hypothetical protein